ncbi:MULTISPECIES: M24 family metallopeptidase [Bacillaceae]|uniref:Xaa-Pro peptidase family protein n=1 Tax=Evansella alkalicola TaxID=745819 RepID=A0ABS6JRE0_9BACI|nr:MULTISPECIES: Xaa-Pro peptidase family protein [Bacillaceae]MBU9721129.1 Xaa-Pro peptidase family protein [Bacillus alkalicola]
MLLEKRMSKLKQWMKDSDIDIIMCQTRANVFYYSGFDTDPHERLVAIFIPQNDQPFMVCPGMEVNQVQSIFSTGEIIGYTDTENPWEKINNALRSRNLSPNKMAIEKLLSWERVKYLTQICPLTELIEVDEVVLNSRLIKSDDEIRNLREAAKLADYGIQVGIGALKEGITELEVLATIEFELKKAGIREMSFSTMVLFGEKGGDPHGNPGDRKLKKGDSVLFDLGVVWQGYCSDITRTVFFDHVTDHDKNIYEAVLQAQQAALNECEPGNPISNLDKAARGFFKGVGLDGYFPHRIGHGLGIEVHEFPSLNETNDEPLQAGITLTIEPGLYIPNKVGVRIEDDVLITEDGYETLTKFPKELTIVP